ncbi:hypothetical protein IQ06DRAFT_312904 [Phaeosphaeriaceae sp. SRC1lsM3a]|nr:hypothetical protein IQ06DRAFT_312904 [Stagonospora sp. SRC1lsM3a]
MQHAAQTADAPEKRVRFEAEEEDSASDSDSELSESSEDPSSESSSEDENDTEQSKSTNAKQQARRRKNDGITNLRAGQGQKPIMRLDKNELGPDIRDFLKDFLPQLKAANEELVAHRKAGTLKSREIDMVDAPEEEEYIEMDLGLGVLEEKNPDAHHSSDSDSDDTMADDERETNVIGKLMGRTDNVKDAPVIQEVQDGQRP